MVAAIHLLKAARLMSAIRRIPPRQVEAISEIQTQVNSINPAVLLQERLSQAIRFIYQAGRMLFQGVILHAGTAILEMIYPWMYNYINKLHTIYN